MYTYHLCINITFARFARGWPEAAGGASWRRGTASARRPSRTYTHVYARIYIYIYIYTYVYVVHIYIYIYIYIYTCI